MKRIESEIFDAKRALYATDGLCPKHYRFTGPADGASALKESRNLSVGDCRLRVTRDEQKGSMQ